MPRPHAVSSHSMFRMYTPILLLQGYCLYHAYSQKSPYWWYLLIAFVPLLGCILYLYVHFFTRENVDGVSELVKQTINADYTVEKLIKQAEVADTISNKIQLADEYMNRWELEQAIVLYESCLTGFNANDPDALKKLLFAYYKSEQYDKVMELGTRLEQIKAFQFSDAKLAYAQSAAHTKNHSLADKLFGELNIRYANHEHRLAYAEYLWSSDKSEEARSLVDSLVGEINHMDTAEKRLKREVIRKINDMHRSI